MEANSGLYYVRDSPGGAALVMHALGAVFDGRVGFYGGDKMALQNAFLSLPTLTNVKFLPCNRFVNGNVFWGHRNLIRDSEVVAVHSNWINGKDSKRACLRKAGLWALPPDFRIPNDGENARRQCKEHALVHLGNVRVRESGWVHGCEDEEAREST